MNNPQIVEGRIAHYQWEKSAMAVGSFDGMHRGHQYLISTLSRHARQKGLHSVLFTFHPHPAYVLRPESAPSLLTTLSEKKFLLRRTSLDKAVIYPFSESFAAMPAKSFLKFLKSRFGLRLLLVGYDHVFGSDRISDPELLKALSDELGIETVFGDCYQHKGVIVSSTKIRKLLIEGQIERANALLGYDYMMEGEVVHGSKFGRKIGFPTANLALPDPHKLVPLEGVYVVGVEMPGKKKYNGVLNIGQKPTINREKTKHIEVHILNFEGDLYGEKLRIRFLKRLRAEQKFSSIEALRKQIEEDIINAVRLIN